MPLLTPTEYARWYFHEEWQEALEEEWPCKDKLIDLFGICAKDAVKRALDEAQKAGLSTESRDRILKQLENEIGE